MENMSRALLIVAGVLTSMLILGLIVFARERWSSYENKKYEAKEVEEITKFNVKFEAYNAIISGNKMISLVNLADDKNKKNEELLDVKIYAKLMNKSGSFPFTNDPNYARKNHNGKRYSCMNTYIEFVRNKGVFNDSSTSKDFESDFKMKYFKCDDVIYDSANARVREMYFDEVLKK